MRARIYRRGYQQDSTALRVFPQGRDIGEIAEPLGVIEPVSDREAVGDLEPDVAHREVHAPALRLGEQGADLDRLGATRLQIAEQA